MIEVINGKKICATCGEYKDTSEFTKNEKLKSKLDSSCRKCVKLRRKHYYDNASPEQKEHFRQKARDFAYNNPDKIKLYHKRHSEYIKIKKREYRQSHKEIVYKQKKMWYANRKEIDPAFAFGQKMRYKIIKLLRGNIKAAHTVELVGCSFQELRTHLESQFTEGMTWDNYGIKGWHIDHIRPVSSFDLSDPIQQKECFNYRNLQPLWWMDNIKKGAKWEERREA